MDEHKIDADWLTEENALRLREARIDFASFYRNATHYDTQLMDALVLMHWTLERAANTLLEQARPVLRAKLERFDEKTKQLFELLRESVRTSQTFNVIAREEKARLEKLLFAMPGLQRKRRRPGFRAPPKRSRHGPS